MFLDGNLGSARFKVRARSIDIPAKNANIYQVVRTQDEEISARSHVTIQRHAILINNVEPICWV